jgi:hypothetical protein
VVENCGNTVENCGKWVGTILAMPLTTSATKQYLMLENCGNTIYYAVDPAVDQAFLWVFYNIALTTSGFGSIIYAIH